MNENKVLLIVPPVIMGPKRDVTFKSALPPTGLCYMAACLRRDGFEASVLDAPILGLDVETTTAHARRLSPFLIGITVE